MQVFLIDTQACTAAPVTTVPAPVLSLTVDRHRSLLWVSTPSSSLGGWKFPDGPDMEKTPALDLTGEHSSPARPLRSGVSGLEAASAADSPYMPPKTPTGAHPVVFSVALHNFQQLHTCGAQTPPPHLILCLIAVAPVSSLFSRVLAMKLSTRHGLRRNT